MRALIVLAIAGGFALSPAQARQRDRFDVASIKPQPDISASRVATPSPDRFYRTAITLIDLVNYAWDVRPYRIVGGPEWVRTEHWEVNAKAAAAADPPVMRVMVQRLLEERFALKWHRETRQLPLYHLVPARSDGPGPAPKPAEFDCRPYTEAGSRLAEPPPINPRTGRRRCLRGISFGGGVRTITMDGVSTARLADVLSVDVQRHVVDRTGLTGAYDVDLTFIDEGPVLSGAVRGPAGATTSPDAVPLFTALQEQLGLKLESARGPVDVIVIDSAERPTSD